jgi:hypothetical protein
MSKLKVKAHESLDGKSVFEFPNGLTAKEVSQRLTGTCDSTGDGVFTSEGDVTFWARGKKFTVSFCRNLQEMTPDEAMSEIGNRVYAVVWERFRVLPPRSSACRYFRELQEDE